MSTVGAADRSRSAAPTECTEEILGAAALSYAESLGAENTHTLDGLQCADGWAVTTGILGPKDAPANGPMGAPISIVFETEGQFWVPKQPADVCGTSYPSTDDTRPDDALISEALFETACLTL